MFKDVGAKFGLVALTVVSLVSLLWSLTIGTVIYDISDVIQVVLARVQGRHGPDSAIDAVVWELRAPRGLLALIVGAGLALSGVVMQTLVRNPLADPYLLGVASGASVGATAVLTFSVFSAFGLYALTVGALIGALAATACVYFVSMYQGGLTPLRLILSGVVLSSAFSALSSFLVFRSTDARAAQSVMFWMLGSLSGAQWNKLLIPFFVLAICFLVVFAQSGYLDAMAMGVDTAASLGVRVGVLRYVLFIVQAVLVGTMVAIAGGIGFVGLVIPHLARKLSGSVHRRLLPTAALLGSVFLLWVDMLARVAAAPQEIPLGVVTGLIGAPLFLVLMGKSSYKFGDEK